MNHSPTHSEAGVGTLSAAASATPGVSQPAEREPGRQRMISRARLVWQNRRFLACVGAAGLVISAVVAVLLPNEYEATARLMPPDERSTSGMAMLASLSGQAGGLGSLAGDLLGIKSSGALFVEILSSRTVEDRLVDRFHLKQIYRARLSESARRRLEENTSVAEDRKSGVVTIKVRDGDAQRAAALAQAYIEELDRLVSELTTSSAHRERVFLEERLKRVKQELDEASERLGDFSSRNAAIDIQTQGKAMVDAAAHVQGQLIASQAQLEALRQIFTENNVRVRELEAHIAELQRQLDKLGGNTGAPPHNVSSGDDPPYPTIRQLPLLGVKYADLYRRTRIEEAVYQTLTQQYELAKVQEAKETPSVKVLDAAVPPESKASPNRSSLVALATLFSLFAGVVWVLVSASWEVADATNPGKALLQEIVRDTKQDWGEAVSRSSFARAAVRKILRWGKNRSTPPAQ